MSDDWKVQASYRFGEGDLLNVRGDHAVDLKTQLEQLVASDAVETVVTVGQLVRGASVLAPIATPIPAAAPTPAADPVPANVSPLDAYRNGGAGMPATAPPPPAAVSAAPQCIHGPRVYSEGVGKQSGKPYKMWKCQAPRDQECEAQWIR